MHSCIFSKNPTEKLLIQKNVTITFLTKLFLLSDKLIEIIDNLEKCCVYQLTSRPGHDGAATPFAAAFMNYIQYKKKCMGGQPESVFFLQALYLNSIVILFQIDNIIPYIVAPLSWQNMYSIVWTSADIQYTIPFLDYLLALWINCTKIYSKEHCTVDSFVNVFAILPIRPVAN
jgi:hypothetical protein